jgi:hypothetical protein
MTHRITPLLGAAVFALLAQATSSTETDLGLSMNRCQAPGSQEPAVEVPSYEFLLDAEKATLEPFRGLSPGVASFEVKVVGLRENELDFSRTLSNALSAACLDLGWTIERKGKRAHLVMEVELIRIESSGNDGKPLGRTSAYLDFKVSQVGTFIRGNPMDSDTSHSPFFDWGHRIESEIYGFGGLMVIGTENLEASTIKRLREFLDMFKINVHQQRNNPISGKILVDGLRGFEKSDDSAESTGSDEK